MDIRVRETGEVITEQAFRELHENVSFPASLTAETLDEYGADEVIAIERPQVLKTQNAIADGAELVDGRWQTKWIVVDKTPEQLQALVPRSVTMRQARLALLNAGLLPAVNAAISTLPSPQKEAAQIEWEYSQEVQRDKALVQTLGPALGLSNAQLDELFIAAAAL